MRSRRNLSEDKLPPTLADRLMMAVLAPIVLNVSIVIALSAFFKRSHALDGFLLRSVHPSSVWQVSFVLIFVPALVGFALGVNRCAIWLGHLFLTNMEHEKSPLKTLFAWGFLSLMAYLVFQVLD